MKTTSQQIRVGNDALRTTFLFTRKNRLVLSENVANLRIASPEAWEELVTQIRAYNDFTEENDPYKERNFGKVELDGKSFFWKIDLYDGPEFEWGFDRIEMGPHQIHRALTVMEAREY